MGLFSHDHSASTVNNTNTSGQTSVGGDNLGVLLSGVNDSTINATMTDHNAIKAASEIAAQAIKGNVSAVSDALSSNNKTTKEAFDFGNHSLEFGKDALKTSQKAMKESLGFGRDALAASQATTKAALQSNESTLKRALSTAQESFSDALDFGTASAKRQTETAKEAMQSLRKNNEDTISAVRSMASQSNQTAKAALTLADGASQRSQTGSSSDMMKVTIAIAVVLGVAMVAMMRK
ncbi:hypothetical protein VA7868_04612 [Vibrio aerogenes CECT 7868]|uniref:Uncharacterized protein n=1 Tax=Vibrio aerogenes CECT 7868 TaxID=1216006 RepID=A0A1M6FAX8_9VIBR|nr:hypothetical protein [Vibrio aerogenes]SHI94806.1 hypothetical protein VA7868_04612 [Vibrio aerogenes CECT 7868]